MRDSVKRLNNKVQTEEKYLQTTYLTKDWHLAYKKYPQNSTAVRPNSWIRKWVKYIFKNFTEEDIGMANKHMRRYSTSSAIREMQIKTQ